MKKNTLFLKRIVPFVLVTAGSAASMMACNNSNSGPSGPSETFYLAHLSAVNPTISTTANSSTPSVPSGAAQFTLNGDMLTVNVAMTGLDPQTTHPQFVALGNQCPTASADINQDGVIDAVEALPTTGLLVLPLNSDLVDVNNASFPSSDSSGNYTYSQSAPYTQLVAVLQYPGTGVTSSPTPGVSPSASPSALPSASPSASPSPTASASPTPSASVTVIGTLGANQDLALGTRVVIVYGVSSAVTLPATVQTILGLPVAETIPVACGAIQVVSGLPGASPTPSPSPSPLGTASASPTPTVTVTASPSPSVSPS
jgi:hypothetical protein